MAQDVVAPLVREDHGGRVPRAIRVAGEQVRRVIAIPPPAPQPRLVYAPGLVAYVVGTWVAATAFGVISALTVRSIPLDWPTLALGGLTILIMAVYPIRHVEISWVPTTFVHLGLTVTFGPAGAIVGAVAEATGVAIRIRNGWFRTLFNLSSHFLANMAAWAVFVAINGSSVSIHGTGRALAGGLGAGFTHWAVNSGSIAVVRHLSDRKTSILGNLASRLQVMPYSIAYGFAAFTFVVIHYYEHWVGFMALLAPVIILHVYLIIFAWRSHQFAEASAAYSLERLGLLLKEAEASERERTKIAGDLHDGVVQNLAGLAFALSAEASQLRAHPEMDGRADLIELLDNSASETRGAMKDLRTLIIDLAPPTLRREGLHAALLEVLRDIKKRGTNTQLDLPPNLRLRKDRAELIFRVAQEMLRNVAAHAEAKNVIVELTTEDGSAILSIQDDGKGFSQEDIRRRREEGHLGTSAAFDRAEEAGGTLTIDSEPGRGTLVVLTLPIE
jgi:signal transduction histidine kinase